MHAGPELQARDGGGIDVDQPPKRMNGQHVTAAFRAILPDTPFGLHMAADELGALGNLHVLRLPQGEGVHRRSRP